MNHPGASSGPHAESGVASTTLTTTTRRLLVRRDHAVWPFVWRGLLPALGLVGLTWYAVAPFAKGVIERRVQHEVRAALDQRGYGWAQLAVSGQDVHLSGVQPKAGAGDEALAIARDASCPTAFGRKTCAVKVTGQFGAAPPPPAPPPPPPPAPAAAPAAPDPKQVAAEACEAAFARLLADSRIQFESGRARISPSSHGLLDQLARAAKSCPNTLRVEGHTDNVGSAASNLALSLSRAKAVRQALIERGVSSQALRAQGFGLSQPAASNDTPEGRAANRRIEFKAVLDDERNGAKK